MDWARATRSGEEGRICYKFMGHVPSCNGKDGKSSLKGLYALLQEPELCFHLTFIFLARVTASRLTDPGKIPCGRVCLFPSDYLTGFPT